MYNVLFLVFFLNICLRTKDGLIIIMIMIIVLIVVDMPDVLIIKAEKAEFEN